MSNEAINWALGTSVKHSSAKFVLVVMANCADAQWFAWPSVAHISESTGQDRKTVLENIKRLIACGVIEDTGVRKGTTKQVPVYRLKSSENGTVQEYQNRDSTENGTVPKFPSNSTEIPVKQSQISLETVPKTGHGTQKEPSEEPKGTNKRGKLNVTLPDWLPVDAWESWIAHRKSIKAAMSPQAAKLCIEKLDVLRGEGNDPRGVIDQAVMNGWRGLFPIKRDTLSQAAAKPDKFHLSGVDRSGDNAVAEASRRKHGIVIDPTQEYEF